MQRGDRIVSPPPRNVADLGGVTRVGGESCRALSPLADLSNVVPFARARRAVHEPSAPLSSIAPGDRPAPPASDTKANAYLALLAGSLAVHSGLFAAFWQQPKPLASIGVEVVTVEIVIGATQPAGLAAAPGESEVESVAASGEASSDQPAVEETRERTTDAPPETPFAEHEVAPQDKPDEPAAARAAMPQQDLAPAEARPVQLQTPVAEKLVTEKPKPSVVKRERAPERKRLAAKTAERTKKEARSSASVASTAASSIGRGRSDNDTNYRGLVAAHLARHKQYPAAARSSGIQGTGAVTFSLDASGRVTSSSVARGTGVAVLDQELAAMVRRASPFPAPPGGRSVSFTVPISFRLN